MENKKELRQEFLTGERALFQGKDLRIYDTIFADGESPLKESAGIELYNSMFKWKPVCQGGITLGLHFFIFEAVSG